MYLLLLYLLVNFITGIDLQDPSRYRVDDRAAETVKLINLVNNADNFRVIYISKSNNDGKSDDDATDLFESMKLPKTYDAYREPNELSDQANIQYISNPEVLKVYKKMLEKRTERHVDDVISENIENSSSLKKRNQNDKKTSRQRKNSRKNNKRRKEVTVSELVVRNSDFGDKEEAEDRARRIYIGNEREVKKSQEISALKNSQEFSIESDLDIAIGDKTPFKLYPIQKNKDIIKITNKKVLPKNQNSNEKNHKDEHKTHSPDSTTTTKIYQSEEINTSTDKRNTIKKKKLLNDLNSDEENRNDDIKTSSTDSNISTKHYHIKKKKSIGREHGSEDENSYEGDNIKSKIILQENEINWDDYDSRHKRYEQESDFNDNYFEKDRNVENEEEISAGYKENTKISTTERLDAKSRYDEWNEIISNKNNWIKKLTSWDKIGRNSNWDRKANSHSRASGWNRKFAYRAHKKDYEHSNKKYDKKDLITVVKVKKHNVVDNTDRGKKENGSSNSFERNVDETGRDKSRENKEKPTQYRLRESHAPKRVVYYRRPKLFFARTPFPELKRRPVYA